MADSTILTVGVSQPSNEKVISERFAARNASITVGAGNLPPFFLLRQHSIPYIQKGHLI